MARLGDAAGPLFAELRSVNPYQPLLIEVKLIGCSVINWNCPTNSRLQKITGPGTAWQVKQNARGKKGPISIVFTGVLSFFRKGMTPKPRNQFMKKHFYSIFILFLFYFYLLIIVASYTFLQTLLINMSEEDKICQEELTEEVQAKTKIQEQARAKKAAETTDEHDHQLKKIKHKHRPEEQQKHGKNMIFG